ncbi:MAG TPA: membrane protein insertase YidC [Thermodesulfobacteriota bacterium]|nr:membrane protein insertase YidC [Thermodesulfobacteriota bacterium]
MNNGMKLNYIIFLVLSFLIIFLYTTLFTPKTAKKAPQEKTSEGRVSEQTISKEEQERPVNRADLSLTPQGKLITVNTPLYTGLFDTTGGRIFEWRLEKYRRGTEKNSPPVNLLEGSPPAFNTNLELEGIEVPNPIPFQFNGPSEIKVDGKQERLTFYWQSPDGFEVRKIITIDPSSYLLRQRLEVTNSKQVPVKETLLIESFDKAPKNSSSSFFVPDSSSQNNESFIAMVSNEVERIQKPKEATTLSGTINWFGFADKYFMHTFLPQTGEETQVRLEQFDGLIRSTFYYPTDTVPPGKTSVYESKLYLGPMDYGFLESVGYGLENATNYGWVGFIAKPLLWFLKALNEVFNNYGISIIVITVIIRLVFLPLTLKGMGSMKEMQVRMQELKPKMDALKEKYKDDKAKQNQELMKLYTSHGINPLTGLGGCLPLLIQFPIFIALYYVLQAAIELRHSSFLWINDLSSPEHLFDIPGTGIPFRILPLAMGVSWYVSQKMTPTSTLGTDSAQMKIMEFMPIIFTIMFWGLPSGLILYWTVSNILSIAQQLYVNRRFTVPKGGIKNADSDRKGRKNSV